MPNPLMSRRVREAESGYEADGRPPLVSLDCVIERITFHNSETGYSVIKVSEINPTPRGKGRTRAEDDVQTVLGTLTNPVVGETLRCYGQWTNNPQYGPQFQMERYEIQRPATAHAIEKYLGSGMVKGVGPVMAKRIVAKFGADSLEIIEHDWGKLATIPGLGEKRNEKIRKAWEEQREIRDIMRFLIGHGVTPTYATKIYKQYKERSIEIVEQNPYQLANDIWGIGFKSADRIAQNIGIATDAPARLEAGLVYVLNQEMENNGHCFLKREELIRKAAEILLPQTAPEGDEPAQIDLVQRAQAIERALDILVTLPDDDKRQLKEEITDFLGVRESAIYTPSIHTTEKSVSERIQVMSGNLWRSRPTPADIERALAGIPGAEALSEEQQDAVRRALAEPILVLTGGPGTGKTTTTRVIVAAFEALGKRIQIASPTGRAAKRASEVTGREAKTIHRLLAFDPERKGFKHGPGEPLELDVLLIDESSMLDLMLTHSTLRAVPDTAQVIFVGDVDQLPSVGPGNVLSDLIQSGRIPVARLTQVFRQAAESKIITNAHAINQGRMPDLPPPSAIKTGADCVFLEVEDAEEMPTKIAAVVTVSLPKLGFTRDDVTVLAPMQRGTTGARHLNQVLQTALNPARPEKPEYTRGPFVFRVGDRVMQRVNNYDKNVFNGDVGTILEIDTENQTAAVLYSEGPVEYEFVDMDQLVHASVVTIHKSQGSEYPACVIALHTQHYTMLQRNLIYTALTRAKKLAVFVGSRRAIRIAVQNRNTQPRNTRLRERLQGMI